ncbi:MAG: uncharacterized protein A8A55_2400 [Amphiamblys sp. WSBS2006]|nr:MAG: uncharacterized protein A8A55_2400 [Amphiamblys sp. WSBS2006]
MKGVLVCAGRPVLIKKTMCFEDCSDSRLSEHPMPAHKQLRRFLCWKGNAVCLQETLAGKPIVMELKAWCRARAVVLAISLRRAEREVCGRTDSIFMAQSMELDGRCCV